MCPSGEVTDSFGAQAATTAARTGRTIFFMLMGFVARGPANGPGPVLTLLTNYTLIE